MPSPGTQRVLGDEMQKLGRRPKKWTVSLVLLPTAELHIKYVVGRQQDVPS
jgi:hypothetical protein